MFVICVNRSSSCRAANSGVFFINDSLPILKQSSCDYPKFLLDSLRLSLKGIRGKVEDSFL